MRIINFIPTLLIILLLQACLPTMKIEESGIINTRGVDILDEGGSRIIETTIVPYLFDPNAQQTTSILVGKGRTIKEARDEAGKQSSFVLTPGQIRLELYGKEAAQEGIIPFLDTLIRDPRVSDTMMLAVTNQTAKQVIMSEQKSVPINTAQYLQDLIKKEIKRDFLPIITLHAFTRFVTQIGVDPVLPIIDSVDNVPTLMGVAVFRDDKYVDEVSFEEGFLINLLRRRISETPLDATVPLDNYKDKITFPSEEVSQSEESINVFLSLQRGKGKLNLVNEESLHYKADIKMDVELLEVSIPIELKKEDTIKRLENDLNQYYQKKYEQLFTKLQEVNSDVFGLGKIYAATRKGSSITKEEWEKEYPKTTLEFHVDLSIVDYGTVN